jgi:hypothetical protein
MPVVRLLPKGRRARKADRQGVKEFRLGKFAALPTNESLARALRRMTAVVLS